MPKFKPGDPVWMKVGSSFERAMTGLSIGEHAAHVVGVVPYHPNRVGWLHEACGEAYQVDILKKLAEHAVCICVLRPRRDDYQQHEGLGSMDAVRGTIQERTKEMA